jgi:hypothetical protein
MVSAGGAGSPGPLVGRLLPDPRFSVKRLFALSSAGRQVWKIAPIPLYFLYIRRIHNIKLAQD